MTNDCLVTQYVGSVSDNSLLKHRELRIFVNNAGSASNFQITANSNGGLKATPIVEAWSDNTTTTKTCNANGYIQNNGKTGAVISIDNKYNLKSIGQVAATSRINLIGDLEQLRYCTDLEVLQNLKNGDIPEQYQVTGNLSSLEGLTKLKVFIMNKALGTISGTIDSLINCVDLETIDCNFGGHLSTLTNMSKLKSVRLVAGGVSGNLNQIGGINTLENLNVSASPSIIGDIASLNGHAAHKLNTLHIYGAGNTGIYGTLESLVAGVTGRTDTLTVKCNAIVTLNGVAVGDQVVKTYNFATSTWS